MLCLAISCAARKTQALFDLRRIAAPQLRLTKRGVVTGLVWGHGVSAVPEGCRQVCAGEYHDVTRVCEAAPGAR